MTLPFWRRRRREQDLDEELRVHLELAARDRVERGEPSEDAARAARREFGNITLVREVTRDMWAWASLERLAGDVGFGLRLLRRDPRFAAVAVLSLALGIGANTTMFTVVESVLLRPLPYRNPDRLVMVYSMLSFGWMSWDEGSLADADYASLGGLDAFAGLAASTSFQVFLSDASDPVRLSQSAVTPSLFPLLGVAPAVGSGFTAGGSHEVIISNAIWRGRYLADPRAIGRRLLLDGVPHTIVGVMPPGFRFPSRTEVWTPLALRPGYRDNAELRVVGRLAPGVTAEQAAAAVSHQRSRRQRQLLPPWMGVTSSSSR